MDRKRSPAPMSGSSQKPNLPHPQTFFAELQKLGHTTRQSSPNGEVLTITELTPESLSIQLEPGETLGSALLKKVGVDREAAKKSSLCAWCGRGIEGFRDEISRREYAISGMCQPCQDVAFADPEEPAKV